MLLTLAAILFETIAFEVIKRLTFSSSVILILNVFIGVALVEESLKFFAVKERILNDPEFDEPVDAMIYMIVAALGFAAAENFLILLSAGNHGFATIKFLFSLKPFLWQEIFKISLLRFLGATFLHALAAAIVGFFIGLSFFEIEKRRKLIPTGLGLAVLLHGFYNFSIIKIEEGWNILIPFFLLLISAVFVSYGFNKLKQIAISNEQAQ